MSNANSGRPYTTGYTIDNDESSVSCNCCNTSYPAIHPAELSLRGAPVGPLCDGCHEPHPLVTQQERVDAERGAMSTHNAEVSEMDMRAYEWDATAGAGDTDTDAA